MKDSGGIFSSLGEQRVSIPWLEELLIFELNLSLHWHATEQNESENVCDKCFMPHPLLACQFRLKFRRTYRTHAPQSPLWRHRCYGCGHTVPPDLLHDIVLWELSCNAAVSVTCCTNNRRRVTHGHPASDLVCVHLHRLGVGVALGIYTARRQ